ncbi:hypothetical protein ZWY2020_040171 [Hordeum vulgare]|nr:hypothetical protein ZWY2020_040171 [Hordeum vulgare]
MLEEYEKLAAAVPDGFAKLRVFVFPASGADQPATGSGSHLAAVDETGQRYIDAIKCVSADAVAAIRRRESVATAARPRTTPRPPSPLVLRKVGEQIQEFSVVGKYDDPLDPAGCVLDLAAIHAREEAALSMAPVPTILIQEIDEAAGKDRIRMDVYFT